MLVSSDLEWRANRMTGRMVGHGLDIHVSEQSRENTGEKPSFICS